MHSRPRLLTPFVFIGLMSFALPATTPPAHAVERINPAACPRSWQGADLNYWRQSLVNQNPPTAKARLEGCFPTVIPACLGRLRDKLYDPGVASMSNDPPAKDEPRRRPPPELLNEGSTPDSFSFRPDIEAIAKAKGWPAVRYKSRHSGGFDSSTSSLLMIRVPGDKVDPKVPYDRYLNISLPADTAQATMMDPIPKGKIPTAEDYAKEAAGSGPRMPRIFTIVTVEKNPDGGKSKVWFQLNSRYGNDRNYTASSPSALGTCIGCHPSGIRQISPLGYSNPAPGQKEMTPAQKAAIAEMNSSMEDATNDQAADWRGAIDPVSKKFRPYIRAGQGPVLGPKTPLTRITVKDANNQPQDTYPTRTESFIMGTQGPGGNSNGDGCYNKRVQIRVTDIFGRPQGDQNVYDLSSKPPIDWQKVRKAMNCASCHNGGMRGTLDARTDPGTIDYKILVDQAMPPTGADLNPNERIALANCLRAEFTKEQDRGIEWLTDVDCKSYSRRRDTNGEYVPCLLGESEGTGVILPELPEMQ